MRTAVMDEDTLNGTAQECVTYPVEGPLAASFDPNTGALVLESTLDGDFESPSGKKLRLEFSPDAAYGFVRLLRIVESELAMVIADRTTQPMLLQ